MAYSKTQDDKEDTASRRSMRANRSKNTGPELMLRSLLCKTGLKGYRLHRKDIPGTPDVVWIARKVAVFLHGCFWHRCPKCEARRRVGVPKSNSEYWEAKFERNLRRHEAAVSTLEATGWTVLTVWECQLKREGESVLATIRQAHAK